MSVIEIKAGSTIGILNKLPLIIKGKSSKNKVYAFLHFLSPVNKEGKYLVIKIYIFFLVNKKNDSRSQNASLKEGCCFKKLFILSIPIDLANSLLFLKKRFCLVFTSYGK